MAMSDEELPVLNEIIRTGDRSVIKSTRLNLSSDALSDQKTDDIPQFELPARLKMEVLGIRPDAQMKISEPVGHSHNDLESKIDRIINKHIMALRKELRNLLDGTA
ncbi:MAG: hypothetical protein AB8B84_04525 [Granulosicoccus sp.]